MVSGGGGEVGGGGLRLRLPLRRAVLPILLRPLVRLQRESETRQPHGDDREASGEAERPKEPESRAYLVELCLGEIDDDRLGERIVPPAA